MAPGQYADPKTGLALVLVEGTESSTGAQGAGQLLSRVKRDLTALGGPEHYAPGLRVGYAGNVAVSVEELTALEEDLGISSVLVVLAVLAVILAYFRWWSALPLLFLPLIVATVLSFGLVTLPPFGVDQLSSSTAFLGSIVVGNGINYGVIWLGRYVEARRARGLQPEAALCEAVWGALPGTAVAALGAAASYASLVLTQFRGFRQFGIIGAVGMLICWGATFLLSPALVMLLERHRTRAAAAAQRRARSRTLSAGRQGCCAIPGPSWWSSRSSPSSRCSSSGTSTDRGSSRTSRSCGGATPGPPARPTGDARWTA